MNMALFREKNYKRTLQIPEPDVTECLENTDDRRPCWAHGRKALFHRWANSAHPVLPRGVAPSENARYFQYRNVTAIVEYEDGTLGRVYPSFLQFADGSGFDRFTWTPQIDVEGEEDGK
jgi:hypothetical protein